MNYPLAVKQPKKSDPQTLKLTNFLKVLVIQKLAVESLSLNLNGRK